MAGLKVHEIQNIFKYRTKMTKVSGNYKGKEGVSQCPLCGLHPDVQELMTTCETIKEQIDINVDILNIFSENTSYEVAKPCQKYKKYEKKYWKQNELENNDTSSHRGPSAPVMSAAMQYELILLLILCTAQIWIRLIN